MRLLMILTLSASAALAQYYPPGGGGGGGAAVNLQSTTPGTPQAGNMNISGAGIFGGPVSVGTTSLKPTSGVTAGSSLLDPVTGLATNPAVLFPQLPISGLQWQYDFTTASGSSVANLVSGGNALIVVGSPTFTSGGMALSGGTQYAYSAAFSSMSLAGPYTAICFCSFNGFNAVMSLGGSTSGSQWAIIQQSNPSYAGLYTQGSTGPTTIGNNGPTSGIIPLVLNSDGTTVSIYRLDFGPVFTTAATNHTPSGNVQVAFGAAVANGTGTIWKQTTGMVAAYSLGWNHQATPRELQQAYNYVYAYLATRGISMGAYVSPTLSLPAAVAYNGLAATPPMGWSSWNHYGSGVTETIVKAQAAALVSSGLSAVGYQYVNVDAYWEAPSRTSTGNLQGNATTFASGMGALGTYIHGLGLKYGLYTGPGPTTCGSNPGSYLYELQDVAQFAAWGVDYLKYDWCSGYEAYSSFTTQFPTTGSYYIENQMALALQASGRNIVYSLNGPQPWDAPSALGVNMWRTTSDIGNTFASVLGAFTAPPANIAQYAGPGHWNDADMLQVGNGVLTDAQGRFQLSLWSMLASPLIAGNDLTSMSAGTLATLSNTDVIAVDQDALGIEGVQIASSACGAATCYVYARNLTGTNTCAIAFFNADTTTARTLSVTFAAVAAVIPACGSGPYTTTRDLWSHSSLGTLTTSYTATSIPAGDVVMIKVAP